MKVTNDLSRVSSATGCAHPRLHLTSETSALLPYSERPDLMNEGMKRGRCLHITSELGLNPALQLSCETLLITTDIRLAIFPHSPATLHRQRSPQQSSHHRQQTAEKDMWAIIWCFTATNTMLTSVEITSTLPHRHSCQIAQSPVNSVLITFFFYVFHF